MKKKATRKKRVADHRTLKSFYVQRAEYYEKKYDKLRKGLQDFRFKEIDYEEKMKENRALLRKYVDVDLAKKCEYLEGLLSTVQQKNILLRQQLKGERVVIGPLENFDKEPSHAQYLLMGYDIG